MRSMKDSERPTSCEMDVEEEQDFDAEEEGEDELEDEEVDDGRQQEDSHVLRSKYEEMITNTEVQDHRQVFLEQDSEELLETVQAANELFSHVTNTREAALDARLLLRTTRLASERVQQLQLDTSAFDKEEFMRRLREALILPQKKRPLETEESSSSSSSLPSNKINWTALNSLIAKALIRAPSIGFMLGPLALEPKIRKEARKVVRLKKDLNDLKKPKEMTEDEVTTNENETTANVAAIYKRLLQVEPINFFRFFINADSFSQTVENLFHLSFLVRDGKVSIADDEDGQPVLEVADPPTADDYESGAQKKQSVFHFDMRMWKACKEQYNIVGSVIPHRAPSRL